MEDFSSRGQQAESNSEKSRYNSIIIWTFKDNRDRNFYENMGGVVKEEKSYAIDGTELALVGYGWKDINEINFCSSKS